MLYLNTLNALCMNDIVKCLTAMNASEYLNLIFSNLDTLKMKL